MYLKPLLTRFLPHRRQRESVDLSPVEQLAIRYLIEYGPRDLSKVFTEVSATRATNTAEIRDALDRLLRIGLVPFASGPNASSKLAARAKDMRCGVASGARRPGHAGLQ